jgi:hypothetical protein
MNLTPISEISNLSSKENDVSSPCSNGLFIIPTVNNKYLKATQKQTHSKFEPSLSTQNSLNIKPFVLSQENQNWNGKNENLNNLIAPENENYLNFSENDKKIEKRGFMFYSEKNLQKNDQIETKHVKKNSFEMVNEKNESDQSNSEFRNIILNLPPTQKSIEDKIKKDIEKLTKLTISQKSIKQKREMFKRYVLKDKKNLLNHGINPFNKNTKKIKLRNNFKSKTINKKPKEPNSKTKNMLSELTSVFPIALDNQSSLSPNFQSLNSNIVRDKKQHVRSKMIKLKNSNSIKPVSDLIYVNEKTKSRYLKLTSSMTNNMSQVSPISIISFQHYLKNEFQNIEGLTLTDLINKIDNIKCLIEPIRKFQNLLQNIKMVHKNIPNDEKIEEENKISKDDQTCIRPKSEDKKIIIEKSDNSSQNPKSCREPQIIPIPPTSNLQKKGVKSKSKKVCHCNKSMCLRLHCLCFKNGDFCSEKCGCTECYNIVSHRDLVENVNKKTQEINPHAFEPRIIEIKMNNELIKLTKGCNCSKNFCLKNYCECKKMGLQCSNACHCRDCKNSKISIDPKLAYQLSKRKSRKKKKIVLTSLDKNILNVSKVNLIKNT